MITADQQGGVEIVRTPPVEGVSMVRGSVEIGTRGQEAKANTIEVNNAQAASTQVKSFELSNIGSGLLQARITTTKPWLSVLPDCATIPPSMKKTFIVRIATKHLPCGFIDKDFIRISTNGGNAQLPVNLSIAPAHNSTKACEATSSTFSFKRFIGAFLWFILVPAMPPVLLLISVLFASFGHEAMFKLSLGAYIFVALAVAYKKGMRRERKVYSLPTSQPRSAKSKTGKIKVSVVANTIKGIYHKPWCLWAKIISRSDRVSLAREEAIRQGYDRCKVCRP